MGLFSNAFKGFKNTQTSEAINPNGIYCPAKGKITELKDIADGVFSEGMLGQGAAIIPEDGKFYAPFNGTVQMVYDTKHALGLLSDSGIELLIHIGLDTVELGGTPFSVKVKDGQKIKKGDLLATADLKAIEKSGRKTITPIIVTNSDDFSAVNLVKTGNAETGEEIITVSK